MADVPTVKDYLSDAFNLRESLGVILYLSIGKPNECGPKNLNFKIAFQSDKPFGYTEQFCQLQLPIVVPIIRLFFMYSVFAFRVCLFVLFCF